jgi:tripartite-type tricarboxylate transporter receptor subunit TctC
VQEIGMKLRHRVLMVLGLCAAVILADALRAAPFPERPVRLIVPVAPGGGTDILARVLGDGLSQEWHQPVIIDNRPGGSFVVGTTVAAAAEPNGYTLLMMGMPHVVNPGLNPNLPYDSIKDFTSIAMLAHIPVVVVVNAKTPIMSIADLVSTAKAKPGALSFAATSTNGSGHLAGELLKLRAGVDMVHVSYRGSAPALQGVVSGDVPVMFDALVTAKPFIESGDLRPLAVTTLSRAAALPEVPTLAESGFPDFSVSAWLGLLAPGRTPPEIAEALNAAVVRVLGMPNVRQRLEAQGWELLPMGSSRATFAKFIATEIPKWTEVVKGAQLKDK